MQEISKLARETYQEPQIALHGVDMKKDQEKDKEKKYYCSVCGREISEEDFEDYDGMCPEWYEIEIDELDYEDDY
jgi:hypothetical protein